MKEQIEDIEVERIQKIKNEMSRMVEDKENIERVMSDGGEKEGEIEEKKMSNVRDIVGWLKK